MKFGLLYNAYSAASAVVLVGLPHGYGYSKQQTKRKGPFGQERIIKSVHFHGLEEDEDYPFQLGDEFIGDFKSVALSDDGLVAAFGSTNNAFVQVFQYDSANNEWIQLGSDITETNIGYKVALSGEGSILAASGRDYNSSKGRVQVFQYSNNAWSKLGSDILGEDTNEKCGHSLGLNAAGDIVAFGCKVYDNGRGRVRVFEFASGAWSLVGSDIIGAESSSETCGDTVDLSSSGDVVVVGCGDYRVEDDLDGKWHAGRARVFQFSGGSWTQVGLDITGDYDYEYFSEYGLSISSFGDVVAGSSVGNGGTTRIRVFQNSNGSWTQKGTDLTGVEQNFGRHLDLSSDATTFIAAGPGGEAFVYTYSDSNSDWIQKGQGLAHTNNYFLGGVAISADGMVVSTLTQDGAKVYSFMTPSSSPSAVPSLETGATQPTSDDTQPTSDDTQPTSDDTQPTSGGTSSTPTLSPISLTSSCCCCCCEKSSLAKLLFATFNRK